MSSQQVLLLFRVCGKGKRELAAHLSLCSRETAVHLVLIVQLSHGSCLTAGEGGTGSLTQAALATSAGIYACDTKDTFMSFHAQSLVQCPQPVVKDPVCVDLWMTVLCDPGYPDRIIYPWICASAGYMELIKLWPTLVHLHSPAHSDQ